ncbi:MAG: hypothetical protein AAGG48_16060 [Planctomycetota bacterium]
MTNEDPSSTPSQNDTQWADQGEPYRTPDPVPDPTPRRGILGSPLVWALTACVVVGAGAVAWAWQRADDDAVQYIEEFGGYRGPAPDWEELGSYEEAMTSDSPAP